MMIKQKLQQRIASIMVLLLLAIPITTYAIPIPENIKLWGEDAMGDANVDYVRVSQQTDGTWRFEVTVSHADTGWEDYADGWDVVLPNGDVLLVNPDDPFTRLLLHPHVEEQPFTRSQAGIVIPDDVTMVTVRAHDLVDGYGGQEVIVDLNVSQGDNFEVNRSG